MLRHEKVYCYINLNCHHNMFINAQEIVDSLGICSKYYAIYPYSCFWLKKSSCRSVGRHVYKNEGSDSSKACASLFMYYICLPGSKCTFDFNWIGQVSFLSFVPWINSYWYKNSSANADGTIWFIYTSKRRLFRRCSKFKHMVNFVRFQPIHSSWNKDFSEAPLEIKNKAR